RRWNAGGRVCRRRLGTRGVGCAATRESEAGSQEVKSAKTAPPPFVLVADTISTETIACLETLLEHAKAGDIIGIAYTCMLKRRGYIANSAGEAYRNPTFTRGMVRALDDQLAQRIRGGTP